jgi:hypothetical protein
MAARCLRSGENRRSVSSGLLYNTVPIRNVVQLGGAPGYGRLNLRAATRSGRDRELPAYEP